ncbi:hypothetical protein DUI87_00743 [Hirundo rustica rustica]|uniref:MIF4G domain-containing protein n=1 Tax=Hirundo rustica rustica TaxID=333673 RepID=A0A3M0LA98_HIRRU|nr:hypothetical protein DUI87_00743 [Hirundo rustica rustica]
MSRRRHSDDSDGEPRIAPEVARQGGWIGRDGGAAGFLRRRGEELETQGAETRLSGGFCQLSFLSLTKCKCTSATRKAYCLHNIGGFAECQELQFGGEFVEAMIRQLKECLKVNMYNEAVHLVRFLSDLVNCHVIAAPSMVAMFENFVSVTQEEDVPQVRCDWYMFAFLSSLPWVGKELYEKKDAEMDRLLSQTESYLKRRQKIHVPMLQVWTADKPHPQEEYLDCLWSQIQKLKKDRWQERHILRPYLAFDSVLCEALQHNLPPFTPPPHTEDSVYPMPRVIFRMFDYTDDPEGPVMPGSHSVERFVIEENLHCIIKSHWKERKTCAAQLLSYPGNNKIPLNYHIVEVIFAELFQLPSPPHIEVMYTTLLIELCKLQPGSLPQVLAQATEMLYMRLDTMNTTCVDRSDCLTQDLEKPKPKFVREVLEKCMRLSYHQRIIDIVPASFSVLSPANPVCIYKYGDESNRSLPGYTVALCLTIAIKNKASNDEIFSILKDVPNPNQDDDDGEGFTFNPLKIEVFVQTLLHLAAKSFSHSFSALAKFYIWEILHSTIRKMNKHVLKIHKELEETKARLARQHKRWSHSITEGLQVGQAGLGLGKAMLAVPNHMPVLHVPKHSSQQDLLHDLPRHRDSPALFLSPVPEGSLPGNRIDCVPEKLKVCFPKVQGPLLTPFLTHIPQDSELHQGMITAFQATSYFDVPH